MIDRKPSITENRLLLLYSLKELIPCTNLQLWQFTAENNLMDYFTFQLSLGEMVESGQVVSVPHPIGSLYALTPQGEESLTLFEAKIPHSRKELIQAQSPLWKSRFEKEQLYLANYYKNSDDSYTLLLSLFEKQEMIFYLHLPLPDRQSCNEYVAAWPQSASAIYAHFMALLAQGFSLSATKTHYTLANDTHLIPLEKGFVFEGSWQPAGEKAMGVSSILPSEEMALHIGERWPQKREAFFAFVHQALGTR